MLLVAGAIHAARLRFVLHTRSRNITYNVLIEIWFRLFSDATREEIANVCVLPSPISRPPAATTATACAGDLNTFAV